MNGEEHRVGWGKWIRARWKGKCGGCGKEHRMMLTKLGRDYLCTPCYRRLTNRARRRRQRQAAA